MFKILEEEKPEYLAVAFDVHAPTFRHKMYEAYKGTRKPMPEELREQVPVMKEILKAMHITIMEQAGLEADDILGTLAKKAEQAGLEVSLVSGDRDLLQIATDHIKIRIPKTKQGRTEIEDYYAADVLAAYQVTPLQFIELKALMGDTADNIPGVPKVGEKTAQALMVYYISPKIWAWKEYRIKNIKRDVDELFSILPFEVDFFKKYNYPIHYVGNPCVDAVHCFKQGYAESFEEFTLRNGLDKKPIIALLAGSRKQEIKDNLQRMIQASRNYTEYQFVIAGAPGISPEFYQAYMGDDTKIIFGQTYSLLSHATAALVTSGTATLETALFRVPQVVCYYTAAGKLVSFLRRHILKVKYISLVNLIAGREVVAELVADGMTAENVKQQLEAILPGQMTREQMLQNYDALIKILGQEGASERAAGKIVELLSQKYNRSLQ